MDKVGVGKVGCTLRQAFLPNLSLPFCCLFLYFRCNIYVCVQNA